MGQIEVVSCGPLTSIQDHGRIGLARLGIPRSGAMDSLCLQLVNALVGNAPGEAAIELAWMGITLRAHTSPVMVAVTGAAAHVRRDGRAEAAYRTLLLQPGEVLEVGRAERGVFVYVGIGGGFDIAPVLASRSLYARGAIGGLDGRRLGAGDRLQLRAAANPVISGIASDPVPIEASPVLRVLPGPEAVLFAPDAFAALMSSAFTVTDLCDRMAYRLSGTALHRRVGGDLVSTGTVPGAVQVPPDGQPLVLMADCQTVGGYPRIATVISADLRRLAQCRPGTAVRFEAVDIDEAHRILRAERAHQWALRTLPARATGSALLPEDYAALAACSDYVTDGLDPGSWTRQLEA